ncbi:phosphoribosylformylglycinamidine synthase subunit PurQ [Actibacterium sp. 188UL27-1]|uniref:phosphoribosylformylglycinamidine synthase subunit PurQ n=1 Tax=Actibacterium sp. 188UL27-1 TaxID=2786961 RepID=UPI001957ED17|nr:phosphoribosylformylglycinamidine synthase subunit PurQ [Actibacterium sp. 188UL27-1]MBM7067898.1 phosphoribosylformylglycinamidine synthase subunit PurQ [Actibacterium sp. 188UL27-1]
MRAAVITFPGSNCDRDLAIAFANAGFDVTRVWHKDTTLPEHTDIVGLPGGFSFGDYLRCGAIAAQSPICRDVVRFADGGGFVLGVCNGFQILTETGLLPGILMRNAGLTFVAKPVDLRITGRSIFTDGYRVNRITVPVAHHDGNYQASDDELDQLDAEGRVAFRYVDTPNGAARDIAGITSANGRILGMMPHPERAIDPALGDTDGAPLFAGLIEVMNTA